MNASCTHRWPRRADHRAAGELRKAGVVFVLVLVLGTASRALAQTGSCPEVPGLDPLLRPGVVLLLGEMHGTMESPAFVEDVVCHALARRLDVVVGLEIGFAEQAAFDDYLASPGDAAAEQQLLATEHWQRAYQDGRSSAAMLGLVRTLRRHRGSGGDLRLALFDEQIAARDAAMAARLASVAAELPAAFVVALTGNLHARVAKGSPWNESFEPMGLFLKQRLAGREVIALDVGHAGGTAWFCTTGDAADCVERPLRGDDVGARGIYLMPGDSHYSGRYAVGTLRASPPAVTMP